MNVKEESSILSPAAPRLVCKDDEAETNPVPCARSDGAEFHMCVLLLLLFFLIYISFQIRAYPIIHSQPKQVTEL